MGITRTNLSIVRSDNIIPPKAILTYPVVLEFEKNKKINAFCSLGMSNIVIHSFDVQKK